MPFTSTRVRQLSFYLPRRAFKESAIRFQATNAPTLVTGFQPTGVPHLGNYLGVIKPLLRMNEEHKFRKCYILIADLHALTGVQVPTIHRQNILRMAASLCSLGLGCDENSEHLLLQSLVPHHSELCWMLGALSSINRLSGLPQWKDKVNQAGDKWAEKLNLATFSYPILQAADILLYGADVVPVGQDQLAHIELTQHVVRALHQHYPDTKAIIKQPKSLIMQTFKVASLKDCSKKMSKSDPSPKSCLFIDDSPDVMAAKIKSAQTDSIRSITYHPEDRPALANLLNILAGVTDRTIDETMESVGSMTKSQLKQSLTDELVEHFSTFQSQYTNLLEDYSVKGQTSDLACLIQRGTEAARSTASVTLHAIRDSIGVPRF